MIPMQTVQYGWVTQSKGPVKTWKALTGTLGQTRRHPEIRAELLRGVKSARKSGKWDWSKAVPKFQLESMQTIDYGWITDSKPPVRKAKEKLGKIGKWVGVNNPTKLRSWPDPVRNKMLGGIKGVHRAHTAPVSLAIPGIDLNAEALRKMAEASVLRGDPTVAPVIEAANTFGGRVRQRVTKAAGKSLGWMVNHPRITAAGAITAGLGTGVGIGKLMSRRRKRKLQEKQYMLVPMQPMQVVRYWNPLKVTRSR